MKAYGDKLILNVEPINDKIGSILIPETTLKKTVRTRKGVIESLGEADFEVKVGQRLLYDRASETELEGNKVLIPQSAILLYDIKD